MLLLLPGLLAAQTRAVVFIDSSRPAQGQLVNAMNQMLFYSPALRARLAVEVFDINPHGAHFSGGLNYRPDRRGLGAARYRPEALPFLICLDDEKEILRMEINKKEQLCLCIHTC
ncbi:hypothetical protein ACQKDS_06365 [Serratia sp. NPDC078593]|uniref:hypothetical protein n=1 Tax=unclassified Serratia (in: enterobacteria) TaxID=2647522 RepID=UPI0037CD61D2